MEDVNFKKKRSDGNALAMMGMVVGAALGAVVALVHTRGSGQENRKHLNQWAHNRLDDLQHKAEDRR